MKNKYHSKKVEVGGIIFDSKKEAKRYSELLLLEKAGAISELQRQVKYILIPAQRESSNEIYTKGKNKGCFKPGKLLEADGQMKELTVTITLCEYRGLIQENERNYVTIESLNQKIIDLNKQAEAMRTVILSKNPELSEKFVELYGLLFKQKEGEENETYK